MTAKHSHQPFHAYGLTRSGPPGAEGPSVVPVLAVDGSWFHLQRVWSLVAPSAPGVGTLLDVLHAPEADRERVVRWCVDFIAQYRVGDALDAEASAELLVEVDTGALGCPLYPLTRDVVCVGLNYLAHVQEGARPSNRSAEAPEAPIYFTKAASSVIGPNDAIRAHGKRTMKLDYEVELALVLEHDVVDLDAANALDHVFGYAVFNDVSARDLQSARKQWYLGKSLQDTSPLGPWIVPRRCVRDPHALGLELRVNGVVRQRASTSAMIHRIPTLLEDLTAGHRLAAGTVVATGTPEGCGYAMDPPAFLRPGDVIEASVDTLGSQRNAVVI